MITRLLRFFIYTTIVLSPLYIVRFRIFGIPTTLLEILIIIIFLIFLLEKFINKNFSLLKVLPATSFDLPILCLASSAFIGLFVNSQFGNGLGIFKAYFLEPIIFYYITVETFAKEKNIFPLIFSLVITSIWLSALAGLQITTGHFSLAPWELAHGRVTAVYNSANSLGLFLGPVFSLLLGLTLFIDNKSLDNNNQNQHYPIVLFFAIVIFIIGLVLIMTQSRGALFAALSASLFIFYYHWFKSSGIWRFIVKTAIALFLTGLIVAFGFLIIRDDLTPPINQAGYIGYDTLRIRLYLWKGTFGLLQDRPFFGAGLNHFKGLYAGNYTLPQYKEPLQYPHNFILTAYTELGIIGLISFIFLFWRIFRILTSMDVKYRVSLGASFLYLLIHGLVDVPYFKNDLSLQFFLLVAFTQIMKFK